MHRTPWTRAPFVRFWLFALLLLTSPVLGQGKAPPSWKAIERMAEEQKLEAAAQGAEARLAQAKSKGDEAEWTRALVRTVQLRTDLHGYETAVRFLREQPWPKGTLPRATLNLFYANALVAYAQVYGWEVRQRESVASSGPVDLKAWTYEEILTEAQRAYEEVWKQRQQLGGEPLKALSEYVKPNTYPEGLRSTLRDAVSYLRVSLLADSSHWRPEQAHEVYRLDLGALLEGTPKVALTDPGVHPLVKVAAVLGDLEAWHQSAGRRESALEARLQRYTVLHQHFTDTADRTRIRQHRRLAARVPRRALVDHGAGPARGDGASGGPRRACPLAGEGVRGHLPPVHGGAALPRAHGRHRGARVQHGLAGVGRAGPPLRRGHPPQRVHAALSCVLRGPGEAVGPGG
ncbi:hypothetical protein QEG98_15875 [Myxococcus sp. MxC21-1]|uniref:hypothetical protein n=1 Tax=Myxococcus sp. MxC21-1 TaxID=3041439 RepID=UPI002930CA62|nr:hypothetical protein [Myxococcus sp. MxC21-1]WNZ64990.1 hypothetical protein QEG98_15875 [Myxococcus sp. MxC21-1]